MCFPRPIGICPPFSSSTVSAADARGGLQREAVHPCVISLRTSPDSPGHLPTPVPQRLTPVVKPWAVQHWALHARIPDKYVWLADSDMVWLRPMRNPSRNGRQVLALPCLPLVQ